MLIIALPISGMTGLPGSTGRQAVDRACLGASPRPGGAGAMGRDPWGINLEYRLGYNYYAKDTYDAYFSHEGRLDTWATIGRRVILRLKDYLLQSEEPLELQFQEGLRRWIIFRAAKDSGQIYSQCTGAVCGIPVWKEDRFSLIYLNNYYKNDDPQYEDSQEDRLTLDWISGSTSAWNSLEYGFSRGDFERSPDVEGIWAVRYTYRFAPQTSIFGITSLSVAILRIRDRLRVQNPSVALRML